MKKTIVFILLILSLLLTGCDLINEIKLSLFNTHEVVGNDNINEINDAYKDIECHTASGYCERHFGFKKSETLFTLTLPTEWEFIKIEYGDAYRIMRDDIEIGTLTTDNYNDTKHWKIVYEQNGDSSEILTKSFIEKSTNDASLLFRYRFSYNYLENGINRCLTLSVNYSEVSGLTAFKLRESPSLVNLNVYTRYNDLSDLKDGSILILGNSFISSSNIGSILNELMKNNEKHCTVQAISRGYATVNTYVNDKEIMSAISSGSYDAVFICGLYSISEIKPLGILKSTCESSDTRLIIFPAHNEKIDSIESSRINYPDLYFMDWKSEINMLIDNGADKSFFCINDAYSHSTPIAGYVGAHMIFRSIYGNPPQNKNISCIDESKLNESLGNYIYEGYIEKIINYFD